LKSEPGKKLTCFLLVSCLACSSVLKIETCSPEMSVDFQRTALRYIPQDEFNLFYVLCIIWFGLIALVATAVWPADHCCVTHGRSVTREGYK
jgi:hypothetical protein